MAKTYEVKVVGKDELPDEIEKDFLPENGSGSDCASYLLIYADGKLAEWYSDAMEKEDAIFCRDLDWISAALRNAFEHGREG